MYPKRAASWWEWEGGESALVVKSTAGLRFGLPCRTPSLSASIRAPLTDVA